MKETNKKKGIAGLLALIVLLCSILHHGTVMAASTAPKRLKLNVTAKTVYTKQTVKLSVIGVIPKKASKSVTWKSSNPKVAKVNKNGQVTGVKAGTATITATSKSNKKVKTSCKITVKKFKETKVSVKVTKNNEDIGFRRDVLEKNKGKFVKITSYRQLQNVIDELLESNDDDIQKQIKKSDFYKQLTSYKKSYFKKNTLCIIQGIESGGFIESKHALYMKRVQSRNGKLIGKLFVQYVDHSNENEMATCDIKEQYYFVEMKSSVAKTMSSFGIVKMYE